jgi:hypothetical protein
MSTLVDDLDDEEIEASLLWTDDEEGDPDNIDPLDEELLLSEPINAIETTLKKTHASKANEVMMNNAVANDNSLDITKLVESEDACVNSCKIPENENTASLNETIVNSKSLDVEDILETTLTDGFVDLNVTFNTRDALETSIIEENTSCLTETAVLKPHLAVAGPDETTLPKSNCDAKHDENVHEESIETVTEDLENENIDKNSSECKSGECQTIDMVDVSKSESCDGVQSSVKVTCTEDGKDLSPEPSYQVDCQENPQDCELNFNVVVGHEEKLDTSKEQDNNHLTVIDIFEDSSVDENLINVSEPGSVNSASTISADKSKSTKQHPVGVNGAVSVENTAAVTHDTIGSDDTLSAKISSPAGCDAIASSIKSNSPSIDDAIKSIRQQVSKNKRTPYHSDEQEPALKRFRQSSEPAMSKKDCNPVVNNSLSSPNAMSPDSQESEIKKNNLEITKKKSIVTFEFQHYSKEASTNPYVCRTCSMKFKEEIKFESHLISSHAMALSISHFNIDLHQYYRQKKEKAIAQSKSSLPKLDGIVDQALITEYNQNVKLITTQKNSQYFCKICENIYSTKNLIIEHLKSPKHILCKKV